jgi:hypothetical protein
VNRASAPPWLRPAVGALAVAALVVASALLVTLAADVLRWDRNLRDGDLAYASRQSTDWQPDTVLSQGLSRSLLGVKDDVAYRAAVAEFWRSDPKAPLRSFEDVTRRSAAERHIARTAEHDPNAVRRSALATLRGALLLEEARNSPIQRQVFVRRAIEQFKRAATLDPANDDAVFDLELSLKLLRLTGQGPQGQGDTRAPLPSPGAGASTSGSGF